MSSFRAEGCPAAQARSSLVTSGDDGVPINHQYNDLDEIAPDIVAATVRSVPRPRAREKNSFSAFRFFTSVPAFPSENGGGFNETSLDNDGNFSVDLQCNICPSSRRLDKTRWIYRYRTPELWSGRRRCSSRSWKDCFAHFSSSWRRSYNRRAITSSRTDIGRRRSARTFTLEGQHSVSGYVAPHGTADESVGSGPRHQPRPAVHPGPCGSAKRVARSRCSKTETLCSLG